MSSDTTNEGGSGSPHDEEILNVFRKRVSEQPLRTGDVVNELPIKRRATQGRLDDLAGEGRLVVEVDGKPKLWRLDEAEPIEPVRHPKIATAERWANYADDITNGFILWGTAALGAAGFVMSYHVLGGAEGVPLPIFQDSGIVAIATAVGIAGSILYGLAFAAQVFSLTVPKIVKRRVDDPLGLDE